MNVLVTGASGFIGRNLIAHLKLCQDCEITPFDVHNAPDDLPRALKRADIIFHLAGVNRPKNVNEFESGNAGLTQQICEILKGLGRAPTIVMSSSVQAALDNPYGVSKRHAEDVLSSFAADRGARVRIFRLKNVFGKWCRPNYNSVVATFCHNIAHDLPIQISDPTNEVDLVCVDDVVKAFLAELRDQSCGKPAEIPSYKLTLGELAGRIQSFHDMRRSLMTPDFSTLFNQQLYATYLSYLPDAARRQQLDIKADQRGCLAEFMKSSSFGQIFVSRTRAGVTRGNHYHHLKTEKFFVVQGEGVVRMRQIDSSQVFEYNVCGDSFQVIDIPPGYTHSIENTGKDDMVTLFWASSTFDPDNPDTYFLPVLIQSNSAAGVAG